jgi:hypothetical protein
VFGDEERRADRPKRKTLAHLDGDEGRHVDDLKGDWKNDAGKEHSRSFDGLLLSPVLRNILCNPINF